MGGDFMENQNILNSEEEKRREEKRREEKRQEEKKDKRRRILTSIVIPVVLGAGLIIVSFWGAGQASRADQLQLNTENMFRRSYYELADSLSTWQQKCQHKQLYDRFQPQR
jgi:flagellar basal body-associated protein FliL